jgi:hypothetical protein
MKMNIFLWFGMASVGYKAKCMEQRVITQYSEEGRSCDLPVE